MTTRAAQALLSEMYPCDDRDNAHSTPGGTWHMSSNRMGSMLDAVERQAVEDAGVTLDPRPAPDTASLTCPHGAEWNGSIWTKVRPAPDTALREAAQAAVDFWQAPDPGSLGTLRMQDRIDALRAALEAGR